MLAFESYRAARCLGLSLDIVSPGTELSGYDLVLAPGLYTIPETLQNFEGTALIGPRAGSKTPELTIPSPMGPNLRGVDATVTRVESLPPGVSVPLENGGAFVHWAEDIEGASEIVIARQDGLPALVRHGGMHYLAGWPDPTTATGILRKLCAGIGIETLDLPEGLRVRDTEQHRFWINYGPDPVTFDGRRIAAADVHWEPLTWRRENWMVYRV